MVSALPVLRARSPCPDNVALRLAGLVEDAHGGHLLLVTPLELCYSVASTLEGNPKLRTPGLDTLEVCLADGADGGEIPLQFCRGLKILRRGALLLRDDGLLRSGANCGPTLGKRYPPPISASSTTEMASSSTNRSACDFGARFSYALISASGSVLAAARTGPRTAAACARSSSLTLRAF